MPSENERSNGKINCIINMFNNYSVAHMSFDVLFLCRFPYNLRPVKCFQLASIKMQNSLSWLCFNNNTQNKEHPTNELSFIESV